MSETDDVELVECPVCDYSAPSLEAVKGHWGGKQDEDHEGAWHEAYEAYEEAREQPGGSDPSGGSAEGSQVEPPAPPEPDVDCCPECGETDYFDPTDYEGYEGDRDRGCPACSTAEEWFLYDV